MDDKLDGCIFLSKAGIEELMTTGKLELGSGYAIAYQEVIQSQDGSAPAKSLFVKKRS